MTRLGGSLASLIGFALATLACNADFHFDEPRPDVFVPEPPDASVEASDAPLSVRCANDLSCALSSLRCESAAGQCVACLEDGHCITAGAARCDTTLRRCVQCVTSGDCGPRQICEPVTRRCVSICSPADQTCPPEFEGCAEELERCVMCREDPHCTSPQTPRCDRDTWRCVECAEDAHCGSASKTRCDRTTGRCAACLTASDCSGFPPACDPLSLTCVPPQ